MNVLFRHGESCRKIEDAGESIHTIFEDVSRKLLILGEPGSGKTILLLQLAQSLLADATAKEASAIPVVLNLSSWKRSFSVLEDWLIPELRRHYGLGARLANRWIENDSLVYLFDGLDEVSKDHRKSCLHALNGFQTSTRQIVICSRTVEYEELQTQMDLHNALELQVLSTARVKRDSAARIYVAETCIQ